MNELEAIALINETFDTKLSETDMSNDLKEVLQWDSFMITDLLTKIAKSYKAKIDLKNLFKVKTVGELIELIICTVNGR